MLLEVFFYQSVMLAKPMLGPEMPLVGYVNDIVVLMFPTPHSRLPHVTNSSKLVPPTTGYRF